MNYCEAGKRCEAFAKNRWRSLEPRRSCIDTRLCGVVGVQTHIFGRQIAGPEADRFATERQVQLYQDLPIPRRSCERLLGSKSVGVRPVKRHAVDLKTQILFGRNGTPA